MHMLRLGTTMMVVGAVALAASACSGSEHVAGQDQGRSLRSTPCRAAALSAVLSGRDGAALPTPPGAEGAALVAVVFTNHGDRSCVLQGWPNIRLSSSGRDFGPDALRIRSVPDPAVTLRPGKRAQVYVALHSGMGAYDCEVVAPDALTVTLARGQTLGVGVPSGFLGDVCRSTDETFVGVEAVLPI